jgi:hypothetical protein
MANQNQKFSIQFDKKMLKLVNALHMTFGPNGKIYKVSMVDDLANS